jgi:hypothetical protein
LLSTGINSAYKAKSRPQPTSYKLTWDTLVTGERVINCWAYWNGGFDIEHRCRTNDAGAVDFAAHWGLANNAQYEAFGQLWPLTTLDKIRSTLRPDSAYTAAACAAGQRQWHDARADQRALDNGDTTWVIYTDHLTVPREIIHHDATLDRAYTYRIAYADHMTNIPEMTTEELLNCVVDGKRLHWDGEPTA